MSIADKVQLVEALFYKLDQESAQFGKNSGLSCVSGCGKCCTYPNIEASPLEFLPWAFHLFLNGQAEKILTILKGRDSLTCLIYEPLTISGQGNCSDYKFRGLICRLFGFAANTDKYGKLRLATCKIIKESQSKRYDATTEAISKGLYVPVFMEYYTQLNQIDFQLGNLILPVNKALARAIEEVLQYYAYQPSPEMGKSCG
ncbi:YkgJ family cysteine cluster protein [Maribacter chungangensis]|jgi:Fe-S-cluster containining protein|uniref:YkgJ family cysteine cluster protein n=1 Tax=Maribacter chungangensis TaxID=1069117 RepID=A0ABW3B229_9FLAO